MGPPAQFPDKVVSTGSLRLDFALGIGGIPQGQIVEITGPPGSGKTTLCQHMLAEAQKTENDSGTCAIIDADHTFDPRYAALCGVALERLYLCEPNHAEQALDILETFARSGALTMIVLDSVSRLVPFQEIASPLGAVAGEKLDALLANSLHKLSGIIQTSAVILVFTNQSEPGISKVYHGLKNNPARLALPFHSTIRIHLEPAQESGYDRSNTLVRAQVTKNKFAPFYKPAQLDIIINKGVNIYGEIFDLGVSLGIIHRTGEIYHYKNLPVGEERNEVIRFLQMDVSLAEEIRQVIRQRITSSISDLNVRGK